MRVLHFVQSISEKSAKIEIECRKWVNLSASKGKGKSYLFISGNYVVRKLVKRFLGFAIWKF